MKYEPAISYGPMFLVRMSAPALLNKLLSPFPLPGALSSSNRAMAHRKEDMRLGPSRLCLIDVATFQECDADDSEHYCP
jgi:hypothetical protein